MDWVRDSWHQSRIVPPRRDLRRLASVQAVSRLSRLYLPGGTIPFFPPPVTSASSPRSSNGRRSWVWESGSRSPGHWARRAGSALRLHYPVATNPAPRSRLCRPSIRQWPAILNTHYPARKGGSKAPTVPRPGSPSILIPSAPGCASSASTGEATGPRAAIEPDRSDRSVANARDPHRSSDRNTRGTRQTISLGQLELEGILRFGFDRNTVQLARTHLAKGTSGSRAELGIDGPESLGRDW